MIPWLLCIQMGPLREVSERGAELGAGEHFVRIDLGIERHCPHYRPWLALDRGPHRGDQ